MKQLCLITFIFCITINASENKNDNTRLNSLSKRVPKWIQDSCFAASLLRKKSPETSLCIHGSCFCATATCALSTTNPCCWCTATVTASLCFLRAAEDLTAVVANQTTYSRTLRESATPK